jgi:hypothetical protein
VAGRTGIPVGKETWFASHLATVSMRAIHEAQLPVPRGPFPQNKPQATWHHPLSTELDTIYIFSSGLTWANEYRYRQHQRIHGRYSEILWD